MPEIEKDAAIEEKVAQVESWLEQFEVKVTEGEYKVEIQEIDRELLREVLTYFGADFDDHKVPERKEELEKLSELTNKWKRPGMDAVWKRDFMDKFNAWTTDWADVYEASVHKLPKMNKSGSRTSGMRHFLGELTAFTAGHLDFKDYKERQEARILNGWLYAHDLPRKETDFLPQGKKFPGTIPPGYIQDSWNYIKGKSK